MSAFRGALAAAVEGRRATGRRVVWAPYDQLTDEVGPLAGEAPERLTLVMIESPAKAARRPYHRQKLALVLANGRHFALEQARRGVLVRHVVSPDGYGPALERVSAELGPIAAMEPAERELREETAPLVAEGRIRLEPHAGWLSTRAHFEAACPQAPFRMDAFYRHVRKATGVLVDRGKPVGGKWSFDAENREAWRGDPPAPRPPGFEADAVTREVVDLVESRYERHPGRADPTTLPATKADAEALWSWARRECLPHFGPYEDAMAAAAPGLFHTRVAPLVNLHRLLPARVVSDALALDLPLASKEGFVRQILGWREYVRHVHVATDGLRDLPGGPAPRGPRGDAAPSALGADGRLPPAYWGRPSGLRCLDVVVDDVWREGWSHHITRLMVLSNLATLLDVSPRELTDWFWVAYVDAYDWVVEPNVLGMGTYGAGDLMTTKPYVSGAAYIDRMSDYCEGCAFHPRTTCPITPLYWAFLARHAEQLGENHRLAVPLAALRKRPSAKREEDARTFTRVRDALDRGERLTPEVAR